MSSKNQNHYVNREIERVKRKKERSFITRNIGMKRFLLYFLYPITAIWSSFTEGSAIYSFLSNTIDTIPALVFTILLVALIEAGKYWFGKGVIEDLYDEKVKEVHDYISLSLKSAGAILCFGASIALSIFGSPEAAEFWKKATSPIALISEIKINEKFDALIENENSEITKGENMTYGGAITEHGSKRITQAKAAKKEIEKNRRTELTEARRSNKEKQAVYDNKTANSGTWFQSFAGIGEAIAIIILLFCANFDKGIEIEILSQLENDKNGDPIQISSPTLASMATAPMPNQLETLQQAFEIFGKMQELQSSTSPAANTVHSAIPSAATDRRLIRFHHTDRELSPEKLPNNSPINTQNSPKTKKKADRTDKDRNRELVKNIYEKLSSEGKTPSQQSIAELTGLSRKTVGKHIRAIQQNATK